MLIALEFVIFSVSYPHVSFQSHSIPIHRLQFQDRELLVYLNKKLKKYQQEELLEEAQAEKDLKKPLDN